MEITYNCQKCGATKTKEIVVPKTCSNECRLFLMAERQRATKGIKRPRKNINNQEQQMNT